MSENRAELLVGALVIAVAAGFLAYATSRAGVIQATRPAMG